MHGGRIGFDKVLWEIAGAQSVPQGPELTLEYLSPDDEEGYPGTLSVTALYTLTEDNALRLDYTATTGSGREERSWGSAWMPQGRSPAVVRRDRPRPRERGQSPLHRGCPGTKPAAPPPLCRSTASPLDRRSRVQRPCAGWRWRSPAVRRADVRLTELTIKHLQVGKREFGKPNADSCRE